MRMTNGVITVSVAPDGTVYRNGNIYMQFENEKEAIEYLEADGFQECH